MTKADINKLIKKVGTFSASLPEKLYSRAEVKRLILDFVKDVEKDNDGRSL